VTAAVVVCVHLVDRIPLLVEAVASLRGQDLAPAEIVVVVDGDRTVLDAAGRAVDGVQLVWTGGGRGLSRARNQGVAASSAELVAFLDDDAAADPGWLRGLVEAVDSSSVLGASGRSLPRWQTAAPGWMPPELLWTVGCSYRGMPSRRGPVRNFFGGCGLVRRDVFIAVGGFSPELGRTARGVAGGEEAEFCSRALAAHRGSSFVFEPASVIHHYVPDMRAKPAYVFRRCWADGHAKARLVRASGPGALGPERRFVRQVMTMLSGRDRSPADSRVQLAVLTLGVLTAALGFLCGLPSALTRPLRPRPGGRAE
jgi:glucosyl-dolichyl phosphate glucuronosyltransferase